MNSRTLSGLPSDRFFGTSRAACRGSTTDVFSTASSRYCGQAHHGAICRRALGLTRPATIHACVDTNGLPVRLELTTGEAHDNRLVTELLSDLKSGAMLLADRGYDADWIRAFAGEHGAWANIPPKRNR